MGTESREGRPRGRIAIAISSLLALTFLSAAVLLPARAAPASDRLDAAPVVIVSSATGLVDIPTGVLRMAFQSLRTEHKGVRLTAFNLPLGTPVREHLDRVLLGLEPNEVGMFWVDQRVRDGRLAPRTVASVERLVRVVAKLPGAIACVSAAAVDPSVRALRIDGKRASDEGYLLAQ